MTFLIVPTEGKSSLFSDLEGIIFLVLGFKYEINEMVKGGGMILFVSYLFTISFLIDNFSKKKEEKDEK